ncbi:hypothetical protein [Streptomyces javensis]|uniref:Uncharacterized protein n=1 Tax=Streptomyces javensis TaxID=114698 RepID=A0ABS0RPN2_9ACTN|nr:hypothetical protein [Streptomyces javensis]MBI0319303.1 hypothetical protein [Streptomyces javensis]
MSRRKPRSPGVILKNRAAGFHRYGTPGGARGKRYFHHRVRSMGKAELRRLVAAALTSWD